MDHNANRGVHLEPGTPQVPKTARHGHPLGPRPSCAETRGTAGGWLRCTWPNGSNSLWDCKTDTTSTDLGWWLGKWWTKMNTLFFFFPWKRKLNEIEFLLVMNPRRFPQHFWCSSWVWLNIPSSSKKIVFLKENFSSLFLDLVKQDANIFLFWRMIALGRGRISDRSPGPPGGG